MPNLPPTDAPPRRRWQFGMKHVFFLLTACAGWFALARATNTSIFLMAVWLLSPVAVAVFLALPGVASAVVGTRTRRPIFVGALGSAAACLAYALFFELASGGIPLSMWCFAAVGGAGWGAACGYDVRRQSRRAELTPDFAQVFARRQRRAAVFLKLLAAGYVAVMYLGFFSSLFRWKHYLPATDLVQVELLGPVLVGLPTLCGCAALWAVLGRRWFGLRLAPLAAVVSAGLVLRPGDLTLLFGVQAVVVAAAARIARCWHDNDGGARSRPFLLYDAPPLVAAIIALTILGFQLNAAELPSTNEAIAVGVYLAGLTLTAAWAVLSRARLRRRLAALLAAAWIAGDGFVVMEHGRGGLPSFSLSEYSEDLGAWWFVIALLIALLTAVWLRLWQFAWRGTATRSASVEPRGTPRFARRLIGGTAAFVLLAALAVRPASLYRQIVDWPVVPVVTYPEPNAFDELARIDEQLSEGNYWDDSPRPERRALLEKHRVLLPDIRRALRHESQAPLELRQNPSDLVQFLLLSGDVARSEGRHDESLRLYLDARQVCRVAARRGRSYQLLFRSSYETQATGRLARLQPNLTRPQREVLLAELLAPDPWAEPVERYFQRDRDEWIRYSDTWRWRLYFLRRDMEQYRLERMSEVLPEIARLEAVARLLETELALRNYRDDHGSWPKELAKLVPDYLPNAPPDPFAHRPLVYRLDGEAYLLYSIGRDETDNGGRPEVFPGGPGDLTVEQFQSLP